MGQLYVLTAGVSAHECVAVPMQQHRNDTT
jgi:hypothetical protein